MVLNVQNSFLITQMSRIDAVLSNNLKFVKRISVEMSKEIAIQKKKALKETR